MAWCNQRQSQDVLLGDYVSVWWNQLYEEAFPAMEALGSINGTKSQIGMIRAPLFEISRQFHPTRYQTWIYVQPLMIKTHRARRQITSMIIGSKRQLALPLTEFFLPRLECTFQHLVFFIFAFHLAFFFKKLLPPNLQISLLLGHILFTREKSSLGFCKGVSWVFECRICLIAQKLAPKVSLRRCSIAALSLTLASILSWMHCNLSSELAARSSARRLRSKSILKRPWTSANWNSFELNW